MNNLKDQLTQALKQAKPRSLESTLFNMAHAYARASDASWNQLAATSDADFAGPAIMCQSFAVELLLKFFLAVDHPAATTTDDLKTAGVKLKCHRYSELFDQLNVATRAKIAAAYSVVAGAPVDSDGFRAALVEQGDDPFVYWRYVYESAGVSHFDKHRFDMVTDGLGRAAEVHRKAAAQGTR